MLQKLTLRKSLALRVVLFLITVVVFLGGSARSMSRQSLPPGQGPGWEEAVIREANDFYQKYWQAWETRNLSVVSDSLAEDFFLLTQSPGQGPVQVGKQAAVDSVRQFFAAVEGQKIIWRHSILSSIPRTPTEVVLVIRTDFQWVAAGGQTELSLEVVQKDELGHWQIVRKSSERVVN